MIRSYDATKNFGYDLERRLIALEQSGLPWHIIPLETKTLATRQQAIIDDVFELEGDVLLEGTAQLVIGS